MTSGDDAAPPTIDAAVAAIDAGVPAPDAAPAVKGPHSATGNVAGAVKASSPNYKLMGTAGKGDSTAKSPNYKHRGGVVGGTQP